jgi:hypothetical protein
MRTPVNAAPKRRSLRLIFEYEDRKVRLISVQPVEMMAPPPQALRPQVGEAGSWLELRDEAGQALYRRVIQDPLRGDLEVVVEDPEAPLQRVPVRRPSGAFHVVVPEIPGAHTVALASEAPRRRAAGRKTAPAATLEVLEFPLARGEKEK